MGIEISKIANETLKQLATNIDNWKNPNGSLDGDEISIFEYQVDSLIQERKFTREEVDSVFASNTDSQTKVAENVSFTTNPAQKQTENKDPLTQRYNELLEMYKKNKKEYTAKKEAINYEASLEKVKDELKQQKNWDKTTKKAYKELEAYAKEDAIIAVRQYLGESTEHSKRGIRKEVMNRITEDDAFQKEAVKDAKRDRKVLARRNRVESNAKSMESITFEQLADEIGKRSNQYNFVKKLSAHKIGDRIAEKLKDCKDIMNDNGTYNLVKLKEILKSRIGDDYKLNLSDDENLAELNNLKTELVKMTKQEFSNNETKVLVNALGFEREHRDHTPGILKTIAGGIGGAAAAFSSSQKLNVHQTVNLVIEEKEVADQLLGQLAQDNITAEVTELTAGKVAIRIDQSVLKDNRLENTLKGLGIGLLTSAATDIIIGKKKNEKACVSPYDIKPDYTLDDAKRFLAIKYKDDPTKVKVYQQLADDCYKKYPDNWQHKYNEEVNRGGGFGSVKNNEECLMAKYNKLPDPPKPEKTTEPPKQAPVTKPEIKPVEQPKPEVKEENKTPCELVYKEDINLTNANKYFWDEIINMYYSDCLASHSMKEIRYQLRKVNKIPNDYTSVPANLMLPEDLFGDGQCKRLKTPNKFKPSPLRKKSRIVQAQVRKTADGGVYVGNKCPNNDGSYDITWDTQKYKDKDAAKKAGEQIFQ